MSKFYMVIRYDPYTRKSEIDSFWKELYNAESRLEYLKDGWEIEEIHTED
jgi:hypothetical protein